MGKDKAAKGGGAKGGDKGGKGGDKGGKGGDKGKGSKDGGGEKKEAKGGTAVNVRHILCEKQSK